VNVEDAAMSIRLSRLRPRVLNENRRALREGLRGTLTAEEYRVWEDLWKIRCAYCGAASRVIEHVIPIRRGGPTVLENVVPACGSCNNRKGNLLVEEWLTPEALERFRSRFESLLECHRLGL
jgi:5-methylcytosine-specific restriction endonuclease McrA